jgi:hypothetical protein
VGNPQPYIHALATMQIPEDLQEGWGFPAITDEDRRNILGLNYARLLGIDPAAKTAATAGEQVTVTG